MDAECQSAVPTMNAPKPNLSLVHPNGSETVLTWMRANGPEMSTEALCIFRERCMKTQGRKRKYAAALEEMERLLALRRDAASKAGDNVNCVSRGDMCGSTVKTATDRAICIEVIGGFWCCETRGKASRDLGFRNSPWDTRGRKVPLGYL